jgi:hypothetical protein
VRARAAAAAALLLLALAACGPDEGTLRAHLANDRFGPPLARFAKALVEKDDRAVYAQLSRALRGRTDLAAFQRQQEDARARWGEPVSYTLDPAIVARDLGKAADFGFPDEVPSDCWWAWAYVRLATARGRCDCWVLFAPEAGEDRVAKIVYAAASD